MHACVHACTYACLVWHSSASASTVSLRRWHDVWYAVHMACATKIEMNGTMEAGRGERHDWNEREIEWVMCNICNPDTANKKPCLDHQSTCLECSRGRVALRCLQGRQQKERGQEGASKQASKQGGAPPHTPDVLSPSLSSINISSDSLISPQPRARRDTTRPTNAINHVRID
ncbi:hypothetical protein BKA80DRAFT_76388 [Phyllosticta citrichinensis]